MNLKAVGNFLVVLARHLVPLAGKTKNQKISNVIVGLLIILSALGYALPLLMNDQSMPEVPDIIEESEVFIGKHGPMLRMIGEAQAASCRPIIVESSTQLAKCLSLLGIQGVETLVTKWAGGEVVDASQIGWELLPGLLDCAFKFGGYLVSSSLKTDYDSLGASMTPATKAAMALEVNPLAVCGNGEVPQCLIIIPFTH